MSRGSDVSPGAAPAPAPRESRGAQAASTPAAPPPAHRHRRTTAGLARKPRGDLCGQSGQAQPQPPAAAASSPQRHGQVHEIETASLYGLDSAGFRKLLDRTGLACTSFIAGYQRLSTGLDGTIRDAKALGASYILTSDIPHQGELTEAAVKKAAAQFNEWGAQDQSRGHPVRLSPHGFEFVHTPTETLFYVLAAATDPGLVTFELDTFWFATAGADPAAFLERYPGRFQVLHLKDLARGTPRNGSGSAPDEASVAVGSGALRWPDILRAARAAGVTRYYIEDESPGAPAQVPLSVRYLAGLRF